jgi:hypothetical protein
MLVLWVRCILWVLLNVMSREQKKKKNLPSSACVAHQQSPGSVNVPVRAFHQ